MPNALEELFKVKKPIIGMVHLPPLPGSPGFKGRELIHIFQRAKEDAKALEAGGADGLIVENFGDAPYFKTNVPPETVSVMAAVVKSVIDEVEIPVGANVLRNDAKAALAIAHATGGKFIRVNVFTEAVVSDQGIIEACAPELLRYRRDLGVKEIKIFADVHVKHAAPLVPRALKEVARDSVERGMADALIVTGPRTGAVIELEDLVKVKEAVPKAPVLAGSGVDKTNVLEILERCDGVIVGTSLKVDGVTTNPVDRQRVADFLQVVRRIRRS
jgi:membrane complex biogenesis BtpA family protein